MHSDCYTAFIHLSGATDVFFRRNYIDNNNKIRMFLLEKSILGRASLYIIINLTFSVLFNLYSLF